MELTVRHPNSQVPERLYILRYLLERRLGLLVRAVAEDRADTRICGEGERGLTISDGLLGTQISHWLRPDSIPKSAPRRLHLPDWLTVDCAIEPKLPVLPCRLSADEEPVFVSEDGLHIRLSFDLLGSAFFAISRYEEVAAPSQDGLARFPVELAYAVKHEFIERPIVDEYVALLGRCLARLWPNIQLKVPQFRIEVSHDIDFPLKYGFSSAIRVVAGGLRDFSSSRSPGQFIERVGTWRRVRRGDDLIDPYNTFKRLMDESERRSLRSAFYFIAERPAGNRDALYEIDHPWIGKTLASIARRHHEIGLHASFNSYLDAAQTKREFGRLQAACEKVGINQESWGGRQHYLRWKTPDTYRNWEQAGLTYDSSMAFSGRAGFRAGTCHEFHPFDLVERRQMAVIERPLVAMEATVITSMGLGLGQAAADKFTELKSRCRAHKGIFSLLWHNSTLTSPQHWQLYLHALDC